MSAHSPLADAWRSIITGTAAARPRDLARALGQPEAALVAAGTPDSGVHRLRPDWAELLHATPDLGDVMVLTRNENAVHEKTGRFGNIRGMGAAMLVLNDAIDLRLFTQTWRFGFDVTVPTKGGPRRSIQIFDRHGDAVIKIYRTPKSDADAFDALCRRFHAEGQSGPLDLEPVPQRDAPRTDAAVDLETLRNGWRGLKDVHHFRRILKDSGADRHQALRLIGRDYAEAVAPDALTRVLTMAADQAVPIMVFVGNRGCVQIHSGRVSRIVARDGWINVLDPGFNLHVREAATASAWVVRKPQADGVVTALELYDANTDNFAILYGVRLPGTPEPSAWRAILETLPRVPTVATEAAE
jgi:putative hemin transport protein